MRSVARRRQTGALPVDNTVNEEMKKWSCRVNQEKVSVKHALLALVGLCHNMIMAVKMVSDLHQGPGDSDLFCERWKRKSANPSTKTPSLGATATNLFDGSGVNNEDFLENQTMETSKTKELTPNLMRTFSVLLDQIVDVTCPCTSADTLDAAPAANALDSTPLDLACKKDRSGKT